MNTSNFFEERKKEFAAREKKCEKNSLFFEKIKKKKHVYARVCVLDIMLAFSSFFFFSGARKPCVCRSGFAKPADVRHTGRRRRRVKPETWRGKFHWRGTHRGIMWKETITNANTSVLKYKIPLFVCLRTCNSFSCRLARPVRAERDAARLTLPCAILLCGRMKKTREDETKESRTVTRMRDCVKFPCRAGFTARLARRKIRRILRCSIAPIDKQSRGHTFGALLRNNRTCRAYLLILH